jgi:ligand-binding sensor domain-containing protein
LVKQFIYLVLFFVTTGGVVYGQTYQPIIYNTLNGLPSDNVYCAAQDANGYMYFGTDFGLVKFDGYKFTHYSNKEGLYNKVVTDLCSTGGDSLLIASYPDALQSIQATGKINTVAIGNKNKFNAQLITKYADGYFTYTRNEITFSFYTPYKKTQIFKIDTLVGLENIRINKIVINRKGKAIFCTSNGLFVWGSTKINYLAGENVYYASLLKNGRLLIVTNKKVYWADDDFNITAMPFQLPATFTTLHIGEEENGSIWFRGLEKGVYRYYNNSLIEMSSNLGLSNVSINRFFKDRDGNFWICTNGAGILFISKYQAQIVGIANGLISNKVLKLQLQKGKLFIGTNNGLTMLQGTSITTAVLPAITNSLKYVYRLQPETNGSMGICMPNIFDFSHPTYKLSPWKDVTVFNHPFRFYTASFAWQQNENSVWCYATRNDTLYQYQPKTSTQNAIPVNQFGIRRVYDGCQYNSTNWLGTDKGILQIQNGKTHLLDIINGEKLKQVFSFLQEKENTLWIATDVGVFKYDGKQFTTISKAGSYGANYCTSLCADNRGNIWVATWDGIIRISNDKPYQYNVANGLPSKVVNTILYDTLSNKLYAGTENGIAVFEQPPGEIKIPYAPIITASLPQKNILFNNNQVLEPEQNTCSFYFSIPWYQGNNDIRYTYSINNQPWSRIDGSELNLQNLTGGKYTLQVKAVINNLGIESPEAVFTFTIKTPFFKKTWFIVLSLLLLQLAVWGIVTYFNKKRKERKLKQQLALQQQMLEQASLKQQAFTSLLNPHFIFNALNSVQHFINQQDRQNANRYLSDFASLIRKNFDASLQSFIPLEEEIENLRLYLQLEKMRFGNKINYTIEVSPDVDTDDWMFPTMLLQPFLENAILHGLMPMQQQGELSLLFAKDNTGHLLITIADNGIGLQKSKEQRQHTDHKSRGMELIQERLTLLATITNCPVTLYTEEHLPDQPNPGTRITISYASEVYNRYKAATTVSL